MMGRVNTTHHKKPNVNIMHSHVILLTTSRPTVDIVIATFAVQHLNPIHDPETYDKEEPMTIMTSSLRPIGYGIHWVVIDTLHVATGIEVPSVPVALALGSRTIAHTTTGTKGAIEKYIATRVTEIYPLPLAQ